MSPSPGGKHGPGHYIGAGSFQGQFVLRDCAAITIQDESGAALECAMPTHVTGNLLVVGVFSIGTNFSVAGWNNRMALTSIGRVGFHWKIATSAVETFLIPANIDTEAGRFCQCCAYTTPADAVQAGQQDVSASNGEDDGIFVRSGILAEAFTDTLLMIAGAKGGTNYDPTPPGAPGIGSISPFTQHGFAAIEEWEAGAKRYGAFYFGQLFEPAADLIANGFVTQTPAIWSGPFRPVASGSKTLRFRIP